MGGEGGQRREPEQGGGGRLADDAGDRVLPRLDVDGLSHGVVLAEEPAGQGLGEHDGVGIRQSRPRVAAQEGKAEHVEDSGLRPTDLFVYPLLVADPEQMRVTPAEADRRLDLGQLFLEGWSQRYPDRRRVAGTPRL